MAEHKEIDNELWEDKDFAEICEDAFDPEEDALPVVHLVVTRKIDTPLEQAPFVVVEAITHGDVTIINIWREYHEDKKWHCFVDTFNPKEILDMLEHKLEEGLFFEVIEFFESGARAASSPATLLARLNMVSGDQHGQI